MAESHGWFLRRYNRTRALQFLAVVEAMAPLLIAPVGPKKQTAAAALLRRFADQDLTIADTLGLHLMDSHRIRSCWSTNVHLGITGVPPAVNLRSPAHRVVLTADHAGKRYFALSVFVADEPL